MEHHATGSHATESPKATLGVDGSCEALKWVQPIKGIDREHEAAFQIQWCNLFTYRRFMGKAIDKLSPNHSFFRSPGMEYFL